MSEYVHELKKKLLFVIKTDIECIQTVCHQ